MRASAPTPAFDRELERRAVMRALLTERFSQLEGGGRARRLVLNPMIGSSIRELSDREIARRRERGSPLAEPLVLPDGRRAAPPSIDGLDPGMIEDWAKHAVVSTMPTDLEVPLPIDWFTGDDFEALNGVVVTGEGTFNDSVPEWTAFHVKHPGSAGWIHLTDVGFAANGATALIYVVCVAGGLNGSGAWFVLEKRDGRWTIAQSRRTWVS